MSRYQGGGRAPQGKKSDEADGDLSNVNPLLLERSSDVNSWREERRKALLSKVFNRNAAGGAPSATTTLSSAQYMPLAQEKDEDTDDRTEAPPQSTNQGSYNAPDGMKRGRVSDQQYILARLGANKARKVEPQSAPPAKLPVPQSPTPSLLATPQAATTPVPAPVPASKSTPPAPVAPVAKQALLKPPQASQPSKAPEATPQLSLKDRILQKYKKAD